MIDIACMRFRNCPRILMEGFPLTLKQGTGIFNYSLHLLESLNQLAPSDIGLILLFDEKIKYSHQFRSQKPLTKLHGYARLMSSLYRSREGLKNEPSLLERSFSTLLPFKLSGVAATAELLFKNVEAIKIPDHFKLSLLEIISKNDYFLHNFLVKNDHYLVNLSRQELLIRILLRLPNNLNFKKISNQYDIFYCPHLSPLYVPGIPRVTTIHDIIPLLRPELVNGKIPFCYTQLLKRNIRHSQKIIAISEATKSDLVNYCAVPLNKVTVIYPAISSIFKPVRYAKARPLLESLNLIDFYGRAFPYLLFVGNIEPKKNIKRILLAFREFIYQHRNPCKLVMVGAKAWGYSSVQSIMDEMIEHQLLIHTDYLISSHLPMLMSHAMGFLFPSLAEGFGLPALEAMACGCPVIASNIPALQEVCGDAAILVNPQSIKEIYQAIAKLEDDEQLRVKLQQKGLARSQMFSWTDTAQKTYEVYQEVCQTYHYKNRPAKIQG